MKQVQMVCDSCLGRCRPVPDGPKGDRLRARLRRQGWRFKRHCLFGQIDLCPDCVADGAYGRILETRAAQVRKQEARQAANGGES